MHSCHLLTLSFVVCCLVLQHPSFNNLTQSFSFNYTQIYPYGVNNTALMWGLVDYNAILFPAGLTGNVNNEFLFGKSPDFTFSNGWPYPRVCPTFGVF